MSPHVANVIATEEEEYDAVFHFLRSGQYLASYPGSLIIAGEEKRAWFQSLTHAPIAPEFWGDSILQ